MQKETNVDTCSVCVCFLNRLCLKWVIWPQQTGGNTDRLASNTITSHLHQEEAEKRHCLTLREIQMEEARIFDVSQWKDWAQREKVRDSRKVLKMRLMSEAELAWDIKYHDVSCREIPPGKGRGICLVSGDTAVLLLSWEHTKRFINS